MLTQQRLPIIKSTKQYFTSLEIVPILNNIIVCLNVYSFPNFNCNTSFFIGAIYIQYII